MKKFNPRPAPAGPSLGRLKCIWVLGADGRLESIWVPDWERDLELPEPRVAVA